MCVCVYVLGHNVKYSKRNLYRSHVFQDKLFGVNSDPTGRVFMKFYTRDYFDNLSTEFKVHCNVTTIISTLLDDRYTSLLGLAEYYLE